VPAGGAVPDDLNLKGPLWKPGDGAGAFWRGLQEWNRDHRSSFRSSVVILAGLIVASSGTVVHGGRLWLAWVLMAAFVIARVFWFRRILQRPYLPAVETVDGRNGSWW